VKARFLDNDRFIKKFKKQDLDVLKEVFETENLVKKEADHYHRDVENLKNYRYNNTLKNFEDVFPYLDAHISIEY
jgi:hypothetical protein